MAGKRTLAGAVVIAALALAAPAGAATYDVGAATRDITPTGIVNLGGFGLGTGVLVPEEAVGRGGQGEAVDERIAARAIVFAQKRDAIAIADIETQGMFAAYQDGPYGLHDIAQSVEEQTKGRLPADHILIASDHSHSGPDTIGAWGGVSTEYLQHIHDQTVAAIVAAFNSRRKANVRAGHSDASDLIYNQSCTRGAQPGQGARIPRARGVRDARQGRDGPRGPGDGPEKRLRHRHVHGVRGARDRRRRQRAARRLAAVRLRQDERRARRRGARDGRRARRHPAVPRGLLVHEAREPGLRRRDPAQAGDRRPTTSRTSRTRSPARSP